MMTEKVIIAGSGGQGIMLLGKILSQSAIKEKKFTTWLPSYGAEVRGGSSFCMVNIASEEIPSPYVEKADTLIIFNIASWRKFHCRVKKTGLVLLNSSLIPMHSVKEKRNVFLCPFTALAIKLGNIKVANMVALGVYLKKKNILAKETVLQVLKDISAGQHGLWELNIKAVEEGLKID